MAVDRSAPPRSPSSSRLRKQLLRGALDDNLRAIENRPRGNLHRRPPLPWTLAGAIAALLLAGFALWLVLDRPLPSALPVAVARPATPATPEEVVPWTPPARVPSQVFPLEIRRVVVDPGHGGSDLGTGSRSGVTEKQLTLDIARRLAERLNAGGFEATLTRDDDSRLLLRERARLANERKADLFVSIHLNWFEDGRANRGIETYFLGPADDPFVNALASAENRESGYTIADVRRLLDSIYADLRQQQSRALATAVQTRLVRSALEASPDVRDRGVKSAPFLVLVTTEMPAILAEVASLANEDEAQLLDREEYRERIAIALFDGIRAYSHSVARTSFGKTDRTEAR